MLLRTRIMDIGKRQYTYKMYEQRKNLILLNLYKTDYYELMDYFVLTKILIS